MLLTQTKLALVMLPCPVVCILLLLGPWLSAVSALLERDFGDWKSSERVVRTMFGKLRGRVVLPQARLHEVALQPVEVFLGIPYASPPVGSLRFLPPMTAAHWDGIREADHFGPNCPQAPPDAPPHWSRQRPYTEEDERDKLQHHSLNRTWSPWPQMAEFLQDNQSEDCLYLNIFAPASVSRTEHSKLPVLIVSAASSLEWGGASLLDATALAAAAHVIVVTFNFRLGVLGFFPAMEEASRSNNALLDQVAALHWIQRNVDNFGGDRSRVTLLGHGKAAGLVHLLAMYPLAKDLFRSVALMSGSALSPWALCQSSNADYFAVQLAERLGCPTQPSAMVECLRHKSADELVELSRFPNEVPDYLCGPFGPIVDNSVITSAGVRAATSQGPFTEHDLLCVVTGTEAMSMFNSEERRNGIETSLKDRLIRTLVRNTFDYHQQEIYLTVANEYTDWTRSVQTKKNALADTVASLSDGTVVGPVMETAVSHAGAAQQSRSGASTHLLVLSQPECPSASNSQREAPNCDAYPEVIPKDLLHLLGVPLRSSQSVLYPEFSRQDVQLSQTLIHYLKNYLKDGNPNGSSRPPNSHHSTRSKEKEEFIAWPQFEPIHKMHLMFTDGKARTGSHWNAHRLSIWNRLLPALHRPPSRNVNHLSAAQLKAHQLHQLLEDSDKASSFAGNVRNMTFFAARSEPSLEAPTTALAPTVKLLSNDSRRVNGGVGATPPEPVLEISTSSLNALAVLTNGPYSRPLLTVLTVGCSLLVVNLLIFVGTFCQHRERSKPKQQAKEITDASSTSKVSIKEEDACLQKTILQKDAAMLFLQDAAGHNLNQHQTTTELFEATLSSDPNLGNAMETCYLYQLPSTFVASTLQRSRPRIPEGDLPETLTSLPNVVPTGVSIGGHSNGNPQQEPDIAVSSSSATTTSGITITSVTLARDPLNQQFESLSQQSSAGLRDNGGGNGGARSSFKGGEETTV